MGASCGTAAALPSKSTFLLPTVHFSTRHFSFEIAKSAVQKFGIRMARLLIKTAGLENRTLELRLGINRIGRDPNCDFSIVHPTISAIHCEVEVSNQGVLLRDCGSTNGTFLNNEPVTEVWLMRGQEVRLGDVELFVEST